MVTSSTLQSDLCAALLCPLCFKYETEEEEKKKVVRCCKLKRLRRVGNVMTALLHSCFYLCTVV